MVEFPFSGCNLAHRKLPVRCLLRHLGTGISDVEGAEMGTLERYNCFPYCRIFFRSLRDPLLARGSLKPHSDPTRSSSAVLRNV
jgi:hypothetical protein